MFFWREITCHMPARFLDTNDEAFIGKWVVRKLSGDSFAVNDIVLWGEGSPIAPPCFMRSERISFYTIQGLDPTGSLLHSHDNKL